MPIAHLDVDAFYASVAVRDNPELRGRPLVVAGSHRRSVVLTASYEARPFGIRSAMPLHQALERCPDLVVVPPTMELYRAESKEIFALLRSRGHVLEPLSHDEAFLDLGEIAFDEAKALVARFRAEVFRERGLSMSAGLACGKMIAKIASDLAKPDGLLAVEPGEERSFLAPLSVGRLWGVGPKTQARLNERGIVAIADILALDEPTLIELFGSSWGRMRDFAMGIDHRVVSDASETKSISTEETFEYDVTDEQRLVDLLLVQARELAEDLHRENIWARSVGIKVKFADFTLRVRQTSLREPTQSVKAIYHAARSCLERVRIDGAPVRLLGTRVAALEASPSTQLSLFAPRS